MRNMKQLSKTERMEIGILKSKGYSLRSIAQSMGRNVSTISREVQRNSVAGEYQPNKADQKAKVRWKYRKPYMKKIRGHNNLEQYICNKL